MNSAHSPMIAAAIALLAVAAALPARAAPIETTAPYVLLLDYDTQTVLYEKKADQLMAPASMAKLMTTATVFEELKQGRLTLQNEFRVSENAWRKGGAASGGSTMFAPLKASISVYDLVQGVIVQSANDACIVLAEGIAARESAFVERMNRRAKEIGLQRSRFKNTTGLPDPEQRVTARDLAILARHIIKNYPEYYHFYSQTDFTFNKIKQNNRNPLLTMDIGVDGMKTGHTEESGYGLVSSAVRDGQRLILVVNGLKSAKERADESRKLLDWGFRSFERLLLYAENEHIADARVFGGITGRVGLVSKDPVAVLVPRGETKDFRARVIYDGPVPAPVAQGQPIGKIRITNGETVVMERELYSAEQVLRGTIPQRALDAVGELVLGLWQRGREQFEGI